MTLNYPALLKFVALRGPEGWWAWRFFSICSIVDSCWSMDSAPGIVAARSVGSVSDEHGRWTNLFGKCQSCGLSFYCSFS